MLLLPSLIPVPHVVRTLLLEMRAHNNSTSYLPPNAINLNHNVSNTHTRTRTNIPTKVGVYDTRLTTHALTTTIICVSISNKVSECTQKKRIMLRKRDTHRIRTVGLMCVLAVFDFLGGRGTDSLAPSWRRRGLCSLFFKKSEVGFQFLSGGAMGPSIFFFCLLGSRLYGTTHGATQEREREREKPPLALSRLAESKRDGGKCVGGIEAGRR